MRCTSYFQGIIDSLSCIDLFFMCIIYSNITVDVLNDIVWTIEKLFDNMFHKDMKAVTILKGGDILCWSKCIFIQLNSLSLNSNWRGVAYVNNWIGWSSLQVIDFSKSDREEQIQYHLNQNALLFVQEDDLLYARCKISFRNAGFDM